VPKSFSLAAPSDLGVRRALGLASTLDAAAPVVVAAPPVMRPKTLGYGESAPAPRETPQAEVRSTGTTRQAAGMDPWRGALAVSLPQRDAPPLPEDWRRALRPTPSMRLVGAGLGLYGLRSVPLLGRERERDAIWADLREVAARQAPRLVLLRGASGVGTSRLAEWVSQRAHELGAATVVKALHSEMGGPSDGVGRMLARHLGCVGLTRAQALERLRRVVVWQGLSPDEAELEAMALVELVVPGPDGGPRVKLHHPAQRYALVRRFLERLGRERPLILWLEDVQWGADALGLAEALLQDGGGPWLILMTALDEGLARRPEEAAALARLTEGPHARELELAPLNTQERRTLVEGLLCLSGELAAQVEERCGGNPMFAVQLVGDWVRRGLLEVTPQGFALKDNHRALPDDLRRLAEERIELALASLPLAAHTTLEVAAALGLRVDAQEWDEVCRYAGAEPPPNVLGALLDHRLLEPAEDGWAFALGIVREVLEQRAKESGAWALLNLSCAYALSGGLRNKDPKVTPWRVGRHFFEAQEWDQAASALGHAAQEGLRRGAFAQAWEALDLKARALTHLGLDPRAARWGEVKLRQVELAEFQGRWAEAKVWAHEAAGIAQRGGHAPLLAEARRRLGDIACAQGRFDEALAFYGGALAEHGWLGDGLGEAKVLVGLGDVSRQLGRLTLARERYALGLARCDELGHAKEVERVRARLLHGLGLAALQGRAFDEARGWLSQAQALDEQRGERLHAAACEVHLGDLDRLEGRLDEAQARYQRALDVGVALGSGLAPHARLGLAHLYLARGWTSQAQELLSSCLDAFTHSGERDDLARAHAALLACVARTQAWDAWDEHLRQASQVFAETQRADLDAVERLRDAEDLARAAGEPERAERARALREAQQARLGASA
jgi:tetratricopeptide (TPR) repeat protein